MILPAKFKYRSTEEEILDQPGNPHFLLEKNFSEMDFINKYLGGTTLTLKGLQILITNTEKNHSILDVGCGSGDMLVQMSKWLQRKGIKASLTGIDINADAITIAKKRSAPGIDFIQKAYTEIDEEYDIIICSLFCHHLPDDEFARFLSFTKEKSRIGFLINDLNRHPIPYYFIWLLSRLFNGTSLLKNDGPLSVLRGFTKPELKSSLTKAEIENYTIRRNMAFRYLITSKNLNE